MCPTLGQAEFDQPRVPGQEKSPEMGISGLLAPSAPEAQEVPWPSAQELLAMCSTSPPGGLDMSDMPVQAGTPLPRGGVGLTPKFSLLWGQGRP